MKKFTLILLLLYVGFAVIAQDNDSTEIRKMPAQISFIDPIGSNGQRSAITANYFSLNILSGKSAGVMGVELAGISNVTGSYGVKGVQVAGIANLTKSNINAVQLAGIINTSQEVTGIQTAGIININKGNAQGVSLAGIMNNIGGAQNGVAVGGITNLIAGDMLGIQLGGLYNKAHNVNGIQASGIYGQSADFYGLQLSGIKNHAEDVKGLQLAGINNSCKTLNGMQIGLVNIADSIEVGMQLGLINVVKKNGYFAGELSYNDVFNANVAYRMGTRNLYTIYKASFTERENINYIAYGLGFGSYVPFSDMVGINIDAVAQQINVDEWWTNTLNLNNRLSVNVYFRFLKRLEVFGGMAVNVSVSSYKNKEGVLIGNPLAPSKNWYKHTSNNTITQIYPGFNVGLRF